MGGMIVMVQYGVGLSILMTNVMVAIYYNVIITYSLYYLFASFQYPLPWASCLSWADSDCSSTPRVSCNVSGVLVANWTQENITCPSSDLITFPVQSPSEQYWDRVALQRSSGLDETGPVVWHLALCLLLSSIFVAVVLCKGIKSSGKVVYFTATLPYVVILILLIRGVTLEGAGEGISYYIGSQSNFTKLMEPEVWKDATVQTLYSLSIGMGGVTTLASYNTFHNKMYADSFVASLTNHGSSVYAGFAIFSILGHMSHVYGMPVEKVVKEGFTLAFVAYPDALAKLPISPLWSILFFFMLSIIGLDTQFTMIEVICSFLTDAFPETLKSKRPLLTLAICVIIFLLGLPCVTTAGIYWVTLIDHFAGSWVLLMLAFMEILSFCYIYGGNNLIKDIEMMVGEKSFCFWLLWKTFWFLISPCLILVIFIWSLIFFIPPTYGGIEYPEWGLTLGWCMSASIFIWIPVVIVYRLMKAEGGFLERVKTTCTPSEDWHPYLEIHRGERYSEESCRQRNSASTRNKPI
nr:PREDICTED: sodium- and chloride-dependent neutral and basic amino acid transporter B(0+)-like [Paralichthys olivaceus]